MQNLKKHTTRFFSWKKKEKLHLIFKKKKVVNKNKVLKTEQFHYEWKEDIVWKLLNLMVEMRLWKRMIKVSKGQGKAKHPYAPSFLAGVRRYSFVLDLHSRKYKGDSETQSPWVRGTQFQ